MAGPAVIPDGSGSGAEMFPLEIFFPDGPDAVSFPELDEASAMSFPRRFRLSLGAGRAELLDLDAPKDGSLFVDFTRIQVNIIQIT